MTIQSISFMGAKPTKEILKRARNKAENIKEEAMYLGKEPIGEIKQNAELRAEDLKSYLDSRQQIIKQEEISAADEIAEAYRAAHGIITK